MFDHRIQRISLFDPSGQFVTSWSVRVDGAPPIQNAVGVTASGDVVLRGVIGNDPESAGTYFTPEVIGVFDRATSDYSPVDTLSGPEGAQVVRDGRLLPAMIPFGRKSDVVTSEGTTFALDGSINVYGPRGLVRIIRVQQAETPVTEDLKEAWVSSFLDVTDFEYEQVAEMWRAGFEQVDLPAPIPRFRSLAPGPSGGVCAGRYGLLESTPPEYWCFSSNGHPDRIVLLPGRLKRTGIPHQDPQVRIAEDHVLGVWQDELGIESVRLYTLLARG